MDDGETRHEKRLKGKMEKRKLQNVMRPRYWMLGASALGRPRGMVWGGRRVQDGEHMYTCGGIILIFGKTNTIM